MSPKSRDKGEERTPPLHPLLTFHFEKDAPPAPDSRRRRRDRSEPPSSITEALRRWLDEQL